MGVQVEGTAWARSLKPLRQAARHVAGTVYTVGREGCEDVRG